MAIHNLLKLLKGEKIILKPGFKVTAGAHFVAQIEPMDLCRPIPGIYDFTQFPDIGNFETSIGYKSLTSYENSESRAYTPDEKNEIPDSSCAVLIYPNPVEEILYIETSHKNYNVTLYNQLGQTEIYKNNLTGNTVLILKEIKRGIYYLTLGDASSVYKTEIIMKK